jgi:hypothetical protein
MPWLSVSWGRRGGAVCRTERTRLSRGRIPLTHLSTSTIGSGLYMVAHPNLLRDFPFGICSALRHALAPKPASRRNPARVRRVRARKVRCWYQELPKFPGCPRVTGPSQPGRGERNFWMQRREAKIGLRDRKCHRRLKDQNDTGENPHRNGLF